MQSIWVDFVAQGTVIKQMVSPTSAAEHGLYMSWGEAGYAAQESTLHRVAVPTHLLHDLAWRACLASQSAVAAHRHSAVLTWLTAAQRPGWCDWGHRALGYWARKSHWRCFFLCCSAGRVSSSLKCSLLVPLVLSCCVSLWELCV